MLSWYNAKLNILFKAKHTLRIQDLFVALTFKKKNNKQKQQQLLGMQIAFGIDFGVSVNQAPYECALK